MNKNLPLAGIRVLDLSRYLPGPFCTQILADFGAEVIKVEDPGTGDLGRHLPPLIAGESARFYTVNRNKKSITLDLRKEEAKEIFKKLTAVSDVVVDQFRPGVMDRLGLGYEELKKINPKLIYCAITGYGLSGPWRDMAGHDLNYLNLAGVTLLNGTKDSLPALCGVQIADIAGGTLYAVIGILMALIHRQKTGEGQLCDIAMLDGSVSLLAYTFGEWAGEGEVPRRGDGLLTGGYACYNVYETKDGQYVSVGAIEEKFWAQFCQKVGRPQYIEQQYRPEMQSEMIADLRNIMRTKTKQEWVDFFAEDDICFTPVLNLEEVSEHPQVKAREMIIKLANFKESGKDVILPGIPIKLSTTPGEVKPSFPALGEHNDEVLSSVGYSREQIRKFREDKVV
ncbi:CaiB/BaiF CoA transferase family protein [Syntrophothermus lipocalidus]|uniref:L-carnitine dehydratase/bile acid-inducible protein F n=1 Tax=Syntrophothermus lipocalidus (strain DSM 12680 / TGB-C1) TaxID=643648 RepID=D7CMT0_SYNLT|nr:CaiB/BaiF CoA-transferase family protein [Syntrophothermus lipocalidus]ADI02015.1 L-carnitine dehydratase/bile acid-inducible protein F [Syntrophothermus lipocalidus DSM 12680]